MNNKQSNSISKDVATVIGYIDIAISYESYSKVKDKYLYVKDKLLNWVRDYNKITKEESLELHTIIDDIKEEILFDKAIGDEKLISDNILIWYEVMIKNINEERCNINVKR